MNLLYPKEEMSSSLSGEMTTTKVTTRRIERLFHFGRRGKFPHSSAKSVLMIERASSFLGTNKHIGRNIGQDGGRACSFRP